MELKTREVVVISDTYIFLKRRLRYSSGHDGSFSPSVITNPEVHMINGNIDSPKKAKKESKSGGKTKIDYYFGTKSKKESCVFQIFLNVFHLCPVPD